MAQSKRPAHSELFMMGLLSSRTVQVCLVLLAGSFVMLFYSFATTEDFLSQSRALYEAEKAAVKKQAHGNIEDNEQLQAFKEKHAKATKDQAQKHADEFANDYHILFIFSKVNKNPKLKGKFNVAFGSLFEHAKFEAQETLHLHFVCDEEGRSFTEEYLQNHVAHPQFAFKVHFHDVSTVAKQLLPEVKNLQTALGQKHPYYEDAIFFLSLTLHKILPDYIHRVVQLDLDLKFAVNIRDVWDEFSYFARENVIGLAYENQPVYRHILWKYRQDHVGTPFGEPPSTGNPGYNSGVILLHLDHMRASYRYKSYIDANMVQQLVDKYSFKGHLGDQDFFTLLSFEHPELFHTLPCVWNRQLCQWWKAKGYEEIFPKYFRCDGQVKIWHGNCDTPIP